MKDKSMDCSDPINIRRGGNTVIATYHGTIGIAKCHPSDTFDYETGAKLALSRAIFSNDLYDKEYFVPAPTEVEKFHCYRWKGDMFDRWNLEHGYVCLTCDAAVKLSYKMLGAIKKANIV